MKVSTEQVFIETEILKGVRSSPGISRSLLARKLQVAPSTVTNYTERLIVRGFLKESQSTEKTDEPGRPPTALHLNPDGGQFIGVDFEARNIMVTSMDFSSQPLKHEHRNIYDSDTVPEIIKKIKEAIVEVLPEYPAQLLAIGVGVPGYVDPIRGVALHYKYIHDWQNVSLVAPLADHFNVPVYLENNVRSMALAELWFGQGRNIEDWLCMGIRSGIGTGIVANSQLLRGADFRAGEIGRWRCPWPILAANRFFSADASTVSGEVELQEVASVRAILNALERAKKAKEKTILASQTQPLTMADVVRAASQCDILTMQVIEVAAHFLGWAVSQLALALAPSRVILAGPLTLLGDTLLRPLRTKAQEILKSTGVEPPLIINSTMGEYSGALGAAALAVHEWKPA